MAGTSITRAFCWWLRRAERCTCRCGPGPSSTLPATLPHPLPELWCQLCLRRWLGNSGGRGRARELCSDACLHGIHVYLWRPSVQSPPTAQHAPHCVQQHIACNNNTLRATTTHCVQQQHIACNNNTLRATTTHCVQQQYIACDNTLRATGTPNSNGVRGRGRDSCTGG